MRSHREIAEEILGHPIDSQGFAPCPGAHLHTTSNGQRDFQITFPANGEFPHCHCFHGSCAGARREYLSKLYLAIHEEIRTTRSGPAPTRRRTGPAPLPKAPVARYIPPRELNLTLANRIADNCPIGIDDDWLLRHSPIPIPHTPAEQARMLLDTIYTPGERILIFTRYRSQGQFIHIAGGKDYRLGNRPGVQAVASPRLPMGADEGVWFLAAPVTGQWLPNPNSRDALGNTRYGRRHGACCTRFPYLVLESDVLPPAVWLRILAQLHEAIVAIYTSGGKSHHALIRVDAATEAQFAAHRRDYVRRLAPVGADPAAITAVRLTRLPGCYRHGKADHDGNLTKYPEPRLQRLLYLHPDAERQPLC